MTVASEVITPSWIEQLAQDGVLVLPFAVIEGFQQSVAFRKRGEELVSVDIKSCGFMPMQGAFAIAQPLRTPLGSDQRLCMFSAPGQALPVEADTIATWLSEDGQDRPSGVTLTLGEFLNDFSPWVALHESQAKQPTMARVSLAALGDLAEQNIIPSLFGFDGEWKAMYSAAAIEPDGMGALTRPPGQPAPLIDMFNPGDKYNTTFELHVRILGSGTNAAQRVLEHIQAWEQAGRLTSFRWHIRAIPAGTEYQPTDGEFLVNKPWTKLIISYQ